MSYELDWCRDLHDRGPVSKARRDSLTAPDGTRCARRFRSVFDSFPARSGPLGRDQVVLDEWFSLAEADPFLSEEVISSWPSHDPFPKGDPP
jgi:hypothetical protein